MADRQHHEGMASAPASTSMWKFFVYSAIGAWAFFVPVDIGGQTSIPLDHLVSVIEAALPSVVPYYALILILAGAVYPFVVGTWRRSGVDVVFSVFKLVGLAVGVMLVFEVGPSWLFAPDVGPFLFTKLVVPVSLLVPVGAVFLALLVGYGLLDYVGVLLQSVMRPIWRTPGRSAIDAVTSFVGSYSLGLLITDRVYQQGKYSRREAAIIATGFSTVSATFMVIVASTLDLMRFWNLYFWTTLLVTFAVTAVTARLWPLSAISDTYLEGSLPQREQTPPQGERLSRAWHQARGAVASAPSLAVSIRQNLTEGVLMTMAILPSILSIGLVGLVLAIYTPLFEWLGYLFYPVTWALQLAEPMRVAEAAAVGIAEMFLPALVASGMPVAMKFIVAVVSVSQVIFFSALVPCVAATQIPISIPRMIVIWFERVVLSLMLVTPVAMLAF